MRHFCSYADSNYLGRLKTLHASMLRHCGEFTLYVLAWDHGVLDWVDVAPANVRAVGLGEFFTLHRDLNRNSLPGPPRTVVEHMWTCGPQWIADVMEETGEPVTYVDADLFAFSSPDPFFAEAGDAPAAFCGHNFARAAEGKPGPTWESHAGLFGEINCGLLHFRDIAVAKRWAAMCLESCYDRPQGVTEQGGRLVAKRYADQKYLEDLVRDGSAIAIQNQAAMVGPWNIHAQALRQLGGTPYFGGKPIGFYHFSGLRELPDGHSVPTRPEYMLTKEQEAILYTPYYQALEAAK